jgi:thiol-disulfide isomerase/thioredoxin
MKRTILILAIVIAVLGCKRQPEVFEFTIRGTIIGQESGKLYLSSSTRIGDEIEIPFENYTFEYSGVSRYMYMSAIVLDEAFYRILIEPGLIVLELNRDSFYEKSNVISGDYNVAMQKALQGFWSVFSDVDFDSDVTRNDISNWMISNSDNFLPLGMLSSWESRDDFISTEKLSEFVKNVKDKNLRDSKEFIELYSVWIARKDNINSIGSKAEDFFLPDSEGNLVSFQSVSKGKLTYIEKSGSWCMNSTNDARNLLPVYDKFKDYGLEIIMIVPESKHDRWLNWLANEQFPWINLVELDSDLPNRKLSYSHMLFRRGNYLVDDSGNVIATDLSAETLNEYLIMYFEPDVYEKYLNEKFEMPETIHILDKEKAIESLDELFEIMSGRPFLIDCWASWCRPCIDEFEYNEQLKAFLEKMNMEIVYISFDRPEDETKWLNTIRENDLQGYHFRAGNSFRKELTDIGFLGTVPAYMIVNEVGEIVVNNAFRPSQTDKLYSQIISVLR